MSSELRAAAERVVNEYQGVGGYPEDVWQWATEARDVAQAYLDATNPADGDELVDEGWLRSIGFVPEITSLISPVSSTGCRVYLTGALWSYGKFEKSWLIPTPRNRTAVRSLLAALGVNK